MMLDKSLFFLEPDVTYLNHGSFGAISRPVFEVYQAWQKKLESQPVRFLAREASENLKIARTELAKYLHTEPEQVVFFTNPTSALNMAARNFARINLDAGPLAGFSLSNGDQILTTDHEYGALIRTWRYICKQTGAIYREAPIHLPLESTSEFVESFWTEVNERTRLIFISHITSPTALVLPISEICHRARQAGIITIVDGAHAPGQIDLDLPALGADIYVGACHKWLCAPKGSAFLYARSELHEMLDPLVISWGYESDNPSKNKLVDYHEWQGTRDLSAFLSVPAAIEFQNRYNWDHVRLECHRLAATTRSRIEAFTGLPSICDENRFCQMFATRLPEEIDQESLKTALYNHFRIEVPIVLLNGNKYLRVSFQAYNSESDADILIEALHVLLRQTMLEF